MRDLSRFVRREYAELRNRPRTERLQAQLSASFERQLTLHRSGSRGRDSIYLVRDETRFVGAVRLCNPHLQRKPLPADMPFVTLSNAVRLEREWQSYQTAGRAGLTPLPLWRDADALMCEFVAGYRLSDELTRDPGCFWTLIQRASATLTALHELGVTHMDASLANVIAEETGTGSRLIDFEYGPARGLTIAQQMAYDHLRLLESSMKFMPPGADERADDWLGELEGTLSPETRRAEIGPLRPAIARLLASPRLRRGLSGIFHTLGG